MGNVFLYMSTLESIYAEVGILIKLHNLFRTAHFYQNNEEI